MSEQEVGKVEAEAETEMSEEMGEEKGSEPIFCKLKQVKIGSRFWSPSNGQEMELVGYQKNGTVLLKKREGPNEWATQLFNKSVQDKEVIVGSADDFQPLEEGEEEVRGEEVPAFPNRMLSKRKPKSDAVQALEAQLEALRKEKIDLLHAVRTQRERYKESSREGLKKQKKAKDAIQAAKDAHSRVVRETRDVTSDENRKLAELVAERKVRISEYDALAEKVRVAAKEDGRGE